MERAEELNIDLNVRGSQGTTPIMFAETKEVMELLLNDDRIDAGATEIMAVLSCIMFVFLHVNSQRKSKLSIRLVCCYDHPKFIIQKHFLEGLHCTIATIKKRG